PGHAAASRLRAEAALALANRLLLADRACRQLAGPAGLARRTKRHRSRPGTGATGAARSGAILAAAARGRLPYRWRSTGQTTGRSERWKRGSPRSGRHRDGRAALCPACVPRPPSVLAIVAAATSPAYRSGAVSARLSQRRRHGTLLAT